MLRVPLREQVPLRVLEVVILAVEVLEVLEVVILAVEVLRC